MKTIYSILIAILILSPVAMSLRSPQSSGTRIVIQASDKNITPASLSASASAIEGRLKDYYPGKASVTVLGEKNQIVVTLKDITDLKTAQSLVTKKGSTGFYDEAELATIKKGEKKDAAVTGKDIRSAACNNDRILIDLKADAVKVWADMTRRNLDKEIALVIDGEVIFSPKVRAVIEGGRIEITGKFTPEELKFTAAILNNGELPADLFIVR